MMREEAGRGEQAEPTVPERLARIERALGAMRARLEELISGLKRRGSL